MPLNRFKGGHTSTAVSREHDAHLGLRHASALSQALKGEADMTDALLRNVYGDDPSMRSNADTLARYVKR